MGAAGVPAPPLLPMPSSTLYMLSRAAVAEPGLRWPAGLCGLSLAGWLQDAGERATWALPALVPADPTAGAAALSPGMDATLAPRSLERPLASEPPGRPAERWLLPARAGTAWLPLRLAAGLALPLRLVPDAVVLGRLLGGRLLAAVAKLVDPLRCAGIKLSNLSCSLEERVAGVNGGSR